LARRLGVLGGHRVELGLLDTAESAHGLSGREASFWFALCTACRSISCSSRWSAWTCSPNREPAGPTQASFSIRRQEGVSAHQCSSDSRWIRSAAARSASRSRSATMIPSYGSLHQNQIRRRRPPCRSDRNQQHVNRTSERTLKV